MAQLRNKYLEPSISRTTDHLNFYTEKSIGEKIAKAGLSIEKLMRENFFFPRQEINRWLASYDWSYKLMQILGRMIKSQVAGFYFVCRRGA